jgi:hypothetical protein
VLPVVLTFLRGERHGERKLAGFCSDLQGLDEAAAPREGEEL